jgi:ribonuclease BN (tRNA processing enzyme)
MAETSQKNASDAGGALKLTVVGAGTILPAQRLSSSCHVLEIADRPIVFDMGPGALARLAFAGLDYRDVETIFISHLHPDHTLDLVTLLQALEATPGWNRTQTLTIVGCRGLKTFIIELLAIFRDAVPQSYALEVIELEVGRHEIAGLTVETCLTGHTSNSLAFRLETQNGVFAYSGDAADMGAMINIARQADMFLCECSFEKEHSTIDHLNSDAVGRIAQAAGVRHLIVTHTYPETDHDKIRADISAHYSGLVTIAVDGTEVQC